MQMTKTAWPNLWVDCTVDVHPSALQDEHQLLHYIVSLCKTKVALLCIELVMNFSKPELHFSCRSDFFPTSDISLLNYWASEGGRCLKNFTRKLICNAFDNLLITLVAESVCSKDNIFAHSIWVSSSFMYWIFVLSQQLHMLSLMCWSLIFSSAGEGTPKGICDTCRHSWLISVCLCLSCCLVLIQFFLLSPFVCLLFKYTSSSISLIFSMSSSLSIAGGWMSDKRRSGLDFWNPISSSAIKQFASSGTVCMSVLSVGPMMVSNCALYAYLFIPSPYLFLIYHSCWHTLLSPLIMLLISYTFISGNCTLVSCTTWFVVPWSNVT